MLVKNGRWRRRIAAVALACAVALPLGLLTAGPAHAVEAASATDYFAQFNDGNVGWYKVALEKDLSNNNARAKVTVWCEPNTTPGGSKVYCDAIDFEVTGNNPVGVLAIEYWNESLGWKVTGADEYPGPVDYSPPLAGLSWTTPWVCTGHGDDQYRAIADNFRAASSNQWSQVYTRVTPTFHGEFC